MGLLLVVFLEVVSLELLFRDKEECGYWRENVCYWREKASVLVQAQTRVLRKVKNAFLSRVFTAGEVGQMGLPLSAAVETEKDIPSSCLLGEQKGLSDLDSEYIAPWQLPGPVCPTAQAILMPTVKEWTLQGPPPPSPAL